MLKYATGELCTSKESNISATLNTVLIPPLWQVVKQRCAVVSIKDRGAGDEWKQFIVGCPGGIEFPDAQSHTCQGVGATPARVVENYSQLSGIIHASVELCARGEAGDGLHSVYSSQSAVKRSAIEWRTCMAHQPRERVGQDMQKSSKAASMLVALVVVVILALFAIQNQLPLRTQFLGWTFATNLWWVVAGSVLLGAICALLLAPGRLASDWRNRSLRREQTHRELDSLRGAQATRASRDQERTALVAENQRLHTEHDGGANLTAVDH